MKPLSTFNYFRHNKKKLASNLLIIVLAICLIYSMECFIASIVESIYPVDSTRFHYCSFLETTEEMPDIPVDWMNSIKENESTDKVIPVGVKQIMFSVPGSTTHTAVFSVRDEDKDYLIQKLNIKLAQGRMPEKGKDEIALDENVAKNNKLKVGDQTEIDVAYNMDRHYKVVGILKNDSHVSLVGSPEVNEAELSYKEKGYLIFPKKGCSKKIEELVTPYQKKGLLVYTYTYYQKLFERNDQTYKVLDAVVVLAIFVMVVCLVCSKYAQYFERRSEFGTLCALGYTQKDLTKRLGKEILWTNILGFIIGLSLALILCKTLLAGSFENMGGTGVFFSWKAVVLSLLAPLLTTIFTVIPVFRLVSRFDAITIIETN